jgi:hypothetical protein
MWARNIDGTILISEDLAQRLKTACVPGTRFEANENEYILGKCMDLERTGDDDRFWFYTEDESYALTLECILSEEHFEIGFIERKTYWIGAIREKTIPLSSLSFPQADLVVLKEPSNEESRAE